MAEQTARKLIIPIVSILLLLLLCYFVWAPAGTGPAPGTDGDASPSPAKGALIKVGVIVSKTTADSQINPDEPVGYERQTRAMNEFAHADLKFIPLIDPGTAADPEVAAICKSVFAGETPIDGADAAQVAQLDVIVASHIKQIPQPMLDSIDQAVRGGTGLYTRMFFCLAGAMNSSPLARELNGLTADAPARYLSAASAQGQVVAKHPILGSLSNADETFNISPNGFDGTLAPSATPLILIDNASSRPPFAVLFTASLGKGSIVVANFAGSKPVPSQLDNAGPERFGVRVIKWLAAQRQIAASQPASAPAN